jgi:hypothetical protein
LILSWSWKSLSWPSPWNLSLYSDRMWSTYKWSHEIQCLIIHLLSLINQQHALL